MGFLLGALLAVVESAILNDRAGVGPHLAGGYRWTLRELAEQDRPAAERVWAVLLQDRLNRTADELAAAGDAALGLVAAAGRDVGKERVTRGQS
jgi:hypothetical protein